MQLVLRTFSRDTPEQDEQTFADAQTYGQEVVEIATEAGYYPKTPLKFTPVRVAAMAGEVIEHLTQPTMLTPRQAARQMQVSESRVYGWIQESRLKAINVGTAERPRYRIPLPIVLEPPRAPRKRQSRQSFFS